MNSEGLFMLKIESKVENIFKIQNIITIVDNKGFFSKNIAIWSKEPYLYTFKFCCINKKFSLKSFNSFSLKFMYYFLLKLPILNIFYLCLSSKLTLNS